MTLVNQSSQAGPFLTLSGQAPQPSDAQPSDAQPAGVQAPAVQSPDVHQLKVTLRDVRPAVWRRLVVASSCTLAELNHILFAAFGWNGSHLHGFQVGDDDYGPSDLGGAGMYGSDVLDESVPTLSQVVPRAGDSMEYTYDFGDDWRHRIEVEQVSPADPDLTYPTCLEGRGLPPEEDTGQTRPGKFDNVAVQGLSQTLREHYGVLGRDLPRPSPTPAHDLVFAGLLPSLNSGLHGLCSCGEIHDDDDGAPVFRPYLPVEPAELARAAADSGLVAQAVALARWVGEGRALTPSRLLRPVEALRAVAELNIAEQAATEGRKFRSAKSLPELHCLWSAAVSAGLIEIRGTKAGLGANLSLWIEAGDAASQRPATSAGGSETVISIVGAEPLELAQARLDNWAALFAGSVRGRSESEEIFLPIYDERLTAISAQSFYATDGEPVPSAMPALTMLAAGDTSPFAALPLFAVTPSPGDTLTTDWIRAGVLVEDDAPGDFNAMMPIDALMESLSSPGGAMGPAVEFAIRPIVEAVRASPIVRLTQLGDYVLRRLLVAHGFDIPQIGDLRNLAPDDLLDQLGQYSPVDSLIEARLWLEARGEQWRSGLDAVISSTRTDDPVDGPVRRAVLQIVLCAAGARVAPVLDALDEDDWLASTAASARHTLGLAAEPSLALQLWQQIDLMTMFLHDEDDDNLAELVDDSDLVELLQHPVAVAAAMTVKHPKAREILSLVAEVSSDAALSGRLRRALSSLAGRPGSASLSASRSSAKGRQTGNRSKKKR